MGLQIAAIVVLGLMCGSELNVGAFGHPILNRQSIEVHVPVRAALVSYMSSGPVIAQVLEGDNAIARNREIMGATDPKKAAPGTIRADLAESIEANVVHGSDSPETAAREIGFFFEGLSICPRD